MRLDNLIKVKNKKDWQDLENSTYVILSVASLNQFMHDEFPQLKSIQFNYERPKNQVEWAGLWTDLDSDVWKDVVEDFGPSNLMDIRDLLTERNEIDHTSEIFQDSIVFVFKMKDIRTGKNFWYLSNLYYMIVKDKKIQSKMFNECMASFTTKLVGKIKDTFGNDLIISFHQNEE